MNTQNYLKIFSLMSSLFAAHFSVCAVPLTCPSYLVQQDTEAISKISMRGVPQKTTVPVLFPKTSETVLAPKTSHFFFVQLEGRSRNGIKASRIGNPAYPLFLINRKITENPDGSVRLKCAYHSYYYETFSEKYPEDFDWKSVDIDQYPENDKKVDLNYVYLWADIPAADIPE